jgi:hypothetical protein
MIKATMLIQSGMLTPPAVTSTRKRTRSNCAMAISQKRIAATSDAGFCISTPPRMRASLAEGHDAHQQATGQTYDFSQVGSDLADLISYERSFLVGVGMATRKAAVVLSVLLLGGVLWTSRADAQCPVGTYPSVDSWGNRICKSFDGGGTRSIEGNLNNCPVGTHPGIDSWGNRMCQSSDSPQKFNDTSKGCPLGTYPWVDSSGNSVCKSF